MKYDHDEKSAAKYLDDFSAAEALDWRAVGRLIAALEKTGRTSGDGQQWIQKVGERLFVLGHKVSAGHLHKVRRAYNFLSASIDRDEISEEQASSAKISSVEIAERLYQLDAREGSKALAACLDPKNPATAAEIKRIYDAFLERHPEKRKAMHAAWDRRKKGDEQSPKSNEHQGHKFQNIFSELQDYVSSLEKALAAKDSSIEELEEELGETKRLLSEAQHELVIVTEDLRELRIKSDAQ